MARSVPAARGRKCKWAFLRVAKYALHSDTDFTGCASAKAGNSLTDHQCAAHVLRREDLHFSGLQPDGRTTDTPLYLCWMDCPSMGLSSQNIRPGGLALCGGHWLGAHGLVVEPFD